MSLSQRPLFPLLFALLALGLSACGDKPATGPDTSKVLIEVNGMPVTEQDLTDYLRLRQAQHPPIPDKAKERQMAMDEMVNHSLLVQEAIARKVDEEPDVHLQIKRQREAILARAMVRKLLKDSPITEEEVKARYDDELAKMHKTQYRARHILVKSEEEAKDIIAKLKGGGKFDALAKQKSIDERSAREGGDLGWFNQGMMVNEFFEATTALKKGQVSESPVKSEFGWHVIKLEDNRPVAIPAYDQIKANVRQLVQQGRIETLVKDLKAKAKISSKE